MITPTVGRIVWYTPPATSPFYGDAPLPAIIARVWSDTCVNLAIFNPNGSPMIDPPTSVLLVQPENERPSGGNFCEWMPYQMKKAAGSESGQKEAGTQAV